MQIRHSLQQYAFLMRIDKPIGTLLLLWPTLWALWLASAGSPDWQILSIFTAGVFLMRSAGCVLNDIADRHIDGHVQRTKRRPLATGKVSVCEAIILSVVLLLTACVLVLFCNRLTVGLAFVGALLAMLYPYLKRITHLPQLGLGLAFTWGIPMAFAAETGRVSATAWFLFGTGVIWTVIYDTMYAMVDRDDDLKIGVHSTAILFNAMDKLIIGLLQLLFIVCLIIVGLMFHLHTYYYLSLCMTCGLLLYQQWLIKDRQPSKCFAAFLNNNWVGMIIFAGIISSYLQ